MKKKAITVLLAASLVLAAGCGQSNSDNVNVEQIPEQVEQEDAQADAQDEQSVSEQQTESGQEAETTDATEVDASDSQGIPRVAAGEIVTIGEDDARLQAEKIAKKAVDSYKLATKHFRPTEFFVTTGAVAGAAVALLHNVLKTDVKS